MVGIEGDRAEVRAREEPKVKTVRWTDFRESVGATCD